MRFVDSHAHLTDDAFAGDCTEVIERARQTGADGIITIGIGMEHTDKCAELARKYPGFIWYAGGIHPHDAASFDEKRDIPALREHMQSGAVAIGECGLDYHYDHSPRDKQRYAFARQLALASETGKPVIIHTREAVDDTLAMVTEAGRCGIKGVLHCFGGPRHLAEAVLEHGWYVSFSGIVTFKKWDDNDLIRSIPEDRILAETDAPYLAPVPHRGKRNEPAWTSFTVAALAQARGKTAAEMGEIVSRNAASFFNLQR